LYSALEIFLNVMPERIRHEWVPWLRQHRQHVSRQRLCSACLSDETACHRAGSCSLPTDAVLPAGFNYASRATNYDDPGRVGLTFSPAAERRRPTTTLHRAALPPPPPPPLYRYRPAENTVRACPMIASVRPSVRSTPAS